MVCFAVCNVVKGHCGPMYFVALALCCTYLKLNFSVLMFQFDLVCNDEWKQPFSSTVYFLGVLLGSFFAGHIADRYRTHKCTALKALIIISHVLLLVSSI